MSRSIDVLLLSPLPEPIGGIATWTKMVLNEARIAGHTIFHVDTAVRTRSLVGASTFSRLKTGVSLFLRTTFASLSIISSERIRTVHICTAAEYGLARDFVFLLIFRLLGLRTVIHLHRGKVPDFPELMKSLSFETIFLRLCIRVSHSVIVLNDSAFSALKGVARKKIHIVENGVSVCPPSADQMASRFEKYQARSELVILFVGYVTERKGAHDLVAAFNSVAATSPSSYLHFCGPCDSTFRDHLLGLSHFPSRIFFHGALPPEEIQSWLDRAYVLCLPSYAEGLPYVVLEAMAAGVPVVSTPVGGISRALDNNSGILVTPGDVEEIASALSLILLNRDTAIRLSITERERCAQLYSSSSMYQSLLQIWHLTH